MYKIMKFNAHKHTHICINLNKFLLYHCMAVVLLPFGFSCFFPLCYLLVCFILLVVGQSVILYFDFVDCSLKSFVYFSYTTLPYTSYSLFLHTFALCIFLFTSHFYFHCSTTFAILLCIRYSSQ